jgi:hypothetical protein
MLLLANPFAALVAEQFATLFHRQGSIGCLMND